MADQIRPTQRSPILGLFSDLVNLPLEYMSSPQRTQQMQGLASLIRSTGVPYTLENLSYDASERAGSSITIDAAYVDQSLGELSDNEDLSRYIL